MILFQVLHKKLYVLLFILLLPTTVFAEDWINPGDETLTLGLGVFVSDFDSSLKVDNGNLGVGTEIDIEDDLGVNSDEQVAWLGAQWRFASKHRMSIEYYKFSRDSSNTAQDDITVGEETFPAGARLNTEFDIEVLPISYHYSFIKSAKHEIAGSFGLHWSSIDFSVDGDAFLGSGNDIDGSAGANAEAPVPLLGINYQYHASKRWTTGVHAQALDLDISDDEFSFSGTVISVRANTEYWLYNNFGVGAALSYFSMDVDVDDSNWQGNLDYSYSGVQVYANLRF